MRTPLRTVNTDLQIFSGRKWVKTVAYLHHGLEARRMLLMNFVDDMPRTVANANIQRRQNPP